MRLIQLEFVAFLIKEITLNVEIEQQNINDVNNKPPKKRRQEIKITIKEYHQVTMKLNQVTMRLQQAVTDR